MDQKRQDPSICCQKKRLTLDTRKKKMKKLRPRNVKWFFLPNANPTDGN